MSIEFEKTVLAEIREMKEALAYRTSWIAGYVALGRYLGSSDKQGRVARAWATEERLKSKEINGTAYFSMADVDRAMRNGKQIETPKAI
ncbi:MAG: hypothetical protein P8R37_12435 [Opitutae bacterium]|nr:hypothetical protein [Opitutae bacterium]